MPAPTKEIESVDELAELLDRFGEEEVTEALEKYRSGNPISRSLDDCPDPGESIEPGTGAVRTDKPESRLERLVDESNLLPSVFLKKGSQVEDAVARVNLPRGTATGFLVSSSLFLTNNHVIGSESEARDTEIEFGYEVDQQGNPKNPSPYDLNPDDVFHTHSILDYTLVRVGSSLSDGENGEDTLGGALAGTNVDPRAIDMDLSRIRNQVPGRIPPITLPPGLIWGTIPLRSSPTYTVTTSDPMTSADKKSRVNIIQHPRGRRKEVALQQNELYEVFNDVIHYRTDTQAGSSGSPVLNNEWKLLALHRAAGQRDDGDWIANEGTRVDRIVEDLRGHYGNSSSGQKVLDELGI